MPVRAIKLTRGTDACQLDSHTIGASRPHLALNVSHLVDSEECTLSSTTS